MPSPQTNTDLDQWRDLAAELGLTDSIDGQWAFGRCRGYPMALTAVASTASTPGGGVRRVLNLLVQLRHPLRGEAVPDPDAVEWQEPVRSSSANARSVSASIEDGIAWLDIYDVGSLPDGVTPRNLISAFIESLESAGVNSNGAKCHYCNTYTVSRLSFSDGRVAQVCDSCLEQRERTHRENSQARVASIGGAILLGGIGAAVGGAAWAGAWIVVDLVVGGLAGPNASSIAVPRVALLAAWAVVTCVVAGPVCLALRAIRHRGSAPSVVLGAGFGIAAVGLGEVGFSAWFVHHVTQVWSLRAAARVLPMLWGSLPLMYLVEKGAAAVTIVFVAAAFSRPRPKPPLL